MSDLAITHSGIDITYDEKENLWRFELRGRERTAPSLAKAKEFIDKPVDKNKPASVFKRILCWREHWGSRGWEQVEAISIAEHKYSPHCWVRGPNGREKVSVNNLYPLSKHNNPLLEELKKAAQAIQDLQAQKEKVAEKMQKLTLPGDNEGEP